MDLNKKKFNLELAGRTLTMEVSKIGEQADAAVLGTYGGTTVLATAVMGKSDRDLDYMPLTVDYEERFYAAGKIIGSRFIRREGRPSDEAILSGRLIDRAIRPLFDGRIRRDIQVVVTVVSYDEDNDPDLVSLITASTALGISDIPWNGPVSGTRVAKIDDKLVLNPLTSVLKNGKVKFETFIASTKGKINMIELSGDEVKEEEIIKAFALGREEIEKINNFQQEIIKNIGRAKSTVALTEPDEKLKKKVSEFLKDKLEKAVYVKDKTERGGNLSNLEADLKYFIKESGHSERDLDAVTHLFNEAIDELTHKKVLEQGARPDGRKMDEIRDLYGEVGLLPRAHGSALFVRGNTQALAVTTIAPPGAEQLVETMEYSGKRRFMLHYNFPPYSVGEVKSFRGPSRRDIGHGALAEKTILPLIPSKENFPYTIRVVSEILSSNGSSSMATVCASILSLMDAGVPIRKQAAGVAMGMMSDNKGNYKILTDIQGPEDHYGDMDLKVAGTADGVNAVQMDVKIDGATLKMLEEAFAQARKARLEILEVLNKVLDKPRPELSKFAPRVLIVDIDPTRIGEVIGPGGKMINGIIARTGVISIDIEETGRVFVAAGNNESAEKAVAEIKSILKEFEIGEIIEGPVIKILDFGAIVDLGGGRDGMVHVSELRNGFVEKVQDVVKLGDTVKTKVIKTENGRVSLSMKQLNR